MTKPAEQIALVAATTYPQWRHDQHELDRDPSITEASARHDTQTIRPPQP